MRIIFILFCAAFLAMSVKALAKAAEYSRAGDKWSAGDYMLAAMVMIALSIAAGIMAVVNWM